MYQEGARMGDECGDTLRFRHRPDIRIAVGAWSEATWMVLFAVILCRFKHRNAYDITERNEMKTTNI